MKVKLILLGYIFAFIYSCENKNTAIVDKEYQVAVNFLENGDYQKAINDFKIILSKEVDDEYRNKTFRNLSIAYQYLDNIDSAKYFSYKSYKNAEVGTFDYYLNIGEYSILTNDYNKALKYYKKAEIVDSNRAELASAFCSLYSGEYSEVFFNPNLAEKYALKACNLRPKKLFLEQLGAVYFQNEKYKQSASIFEKLSKKYPEQLKYTFYYGQAIYFVGQENRGVELMKYASERDEECADMYREVFENK